MVYIKSSFFCVIFGICLVISGCGDSTKGLSSGSNTGGLSMSGGTNDGGGLYQEYQKKFPENLMSLTAQDYMKRWPNNGIVIQDVDGSNVLVYTTVEEFSNVVNLIEQSYPTFNEEAFLNSEADLILAEKGVSSALDLENADVSEEELTAELIKRLDQKLKRIAAEKCYMTFSELIEPDVQQRMQSSMSINWNGKVALTDKQTEMILESYQSFMSSSVAKHTLLATKRMGELQDYELTGDNHRNNAYVHSLWAAEVAEACENVRGVSRSRARDWGKNFTQAREEKENGKWSPSSKMDLHNDTVGAGVFYQNSSYEPTYYKVKVFGRTVAKIYTGDVLMAKHSGMVKDLTELKASAQKAWWDGEFEVWKDREFGVPTSNPDLKVLVYFKD